jgi:AAA family ATP:ADP antiporter
VKPDAGADSTPYYNPIERLVKVRHGEWPRFLLAFTYFFVLLGGYFMLRPLRGTVASNNADIQHLLFTATFISMLLLVPVFGFLVSRFRRGQFIPAIYLFFSVQLGLFAIGFRGEDPGIWVQRAFFVWLSVFNLFVVSIFWSFMADIFRPGQAQRLFGSIMAGGSLGAIAGPLVTARWVGVLGSSGIMLACMICLLVATGLAVALGRYERRQHGEQAEGVIGGRILEGAREVFRSKYLLLICLLMLSHNFVAAIMYQGLAVLVNQEIIGNVARTEFFSYVDTAVQVIAFSLQFFLTSRLVIHLGMPRAAIIPPVLLAGFFVILGSSMGLVLFAAAQVAQRSLNYGMLGPVKEMLFTVVDRETKFKSKNFIDTVVYRGSDVVASWAFKGFLITGLPLGNIVFMYLPVMLIWGLGAWRLGRAYELLKSQSDSAENDG